MWLEYINWIERIGIFLILLYKYNIVEQLDDQ